ncbi:four helix bundle protein [Nostoc sp.]
MQAIHRRAVACQQASPHSEYIQFLHIALGSLRELDSQLIIARVVDLADKNLFTPLLNEVEEMQSILVASLNKLNFLGS